MINEFTLQFHVTDSCMYNCDHCYLEEKNTKSNLSTSDIKNVIDQFIQFLGMFSSPIAPILNITGGDPLLRKDIFEIIEYATSKGCRVGILGNPDLITAKTGSLLKSSGLLSYQVSIDGLETFHDAFRKRPGSYQKSFESVDILHKCGIDRTFTMCNVTKSNISQIVELYETVNTHNFTIARVSSIGNATQVEMDITPQEYRNLLDELYQSSKTTKTKLNYKDPLWILYFQEMGLITPSLSCNISGGCQAGISMLSVMSNLDVYACRRLNIPLGKLSLTENNFMSIFAGNDIVKKMRNFNNYIKCNTCELVNVCRGCCAVAHSQTNNIFEGDPQCWKMI